MLELILCSLITVLPDYLYRRYREGKRWGDQITFFTMWYELRWGITACLMLTVTLITIVFYYHPSTTNAGPYFRTIPLLPEGGGRVEEIFVKNGDSVAAGDPVFSLLDSAQVANVNLAESQLDQIASAFTQAEVQLAGAQATLVQAESALAQAQNELAKKSELASRGQQLISKIELERLENTINQRRGGVEAAQANIAAAQTQISDVIPAQRQSAQRQLEQAQVALDKTVIYAGVDGQVAQFYLQRGDYVNPILRPAGVLIPSSGPESGRFQIAAGFNQLSAQVIKPGTITEVVCMSKPFSVIPMVVTRVQPVVAAGQLKPSDVLLDAQQRARPGSLTVVMEPLYEDGLTDVMPGSKCIANAYTSNHDLIAQGDLGLGQTLFLHMVDTVGVIHAIILRMQALLMPVQMLVFAGH
ncbi:MAG: secretion protein HlyD [Halieaceae bacterium]|nr:secretion protein HlyD [Halieaceae bacterium]|tara:strand:+ start:4024 stop:5265 length:1242 start_codon:yes stop_codon:yes gene_type:complete